MKRTFPALTPVLSGVAALFALAGIAVAGSENATSVINLADVDIDFTNLPRTQQTYAVRMRGRSTNQGQPFPFDSTLTLQTWYDGSQLVLNDTLDIVGRKFTFNFVCEPEATLTVSHGSLRMDHATRSISANLVHDDASNSMRVTSDAGTTSAIEFPDDTVTEAALFRIVTRLPRTPGNTYAFSAYCPLSEIRPTTPADASQCTLTCRGERTINIDRKPVVCTEYVANFEGELTFFVDAQNTLRQVVADYAQTEMTLVPTPSNMAVAGVEDE